MTIHKSIIIFSLFILAVFNVKAQEIKELSKFKNKISEEGNVQIVVQNRSITLVDSNYKIVDFYENGNIARVEFSKTMPNSLIFAKNGQVVSYFLNKNLKEEAFYKDDEYEGLRTQYFTNGKLYKKSRYSKEGNSIVEKVDEVWSFEGKQLVKNGTGKSKEYQTDLEAIEEGIYIDGQRDSTWTGCYESGKLCYKEVYDKGELLKGESLENDGTAHVYKSVFVKPEFKTGAVEMYKFLAHNINYPKKARRAGITGKVFIRFTVDKEGKVDKVFPLFNPDPLLAEEAMRVLKLSSYAWTPGKIRAMNVNVFFTLPINFTLE